MSSPDDLGLAANRIRPVSFEEIVSKTEDIGTDIYHASLWQKHLGTRIGARQKQAFLNHLPLNIKKFQLFFAINT